MFSFFKLGMAILLVFVNAFFVAVEFSFVRIRKTRLEELSNMGNKKAELLLKILDSLDEYLSATQLGITMSALALGWMGEPAVASIIFPLLNKYVTFIPSFLISTISIAIAFSIITFLQIVLGELLPRTIALQKAELIALATVKPMKMFYKLIYPVVRLFNRSARFILSLMSIDLSNNNDLMHSQEELKMIVSASEKEGLINKVESTIIDNVIDFSDLMAREIMTPRQDMICLYTDNSFEENLEIIKETGHTRYPLCEDDKDHIIGVIHIRGFFELLFQEDSKKNIMNIVKKVSSVPEGMSLSNVFSILQNQHSQMAIVADEYGGTAGIITVEDILEEIVGDMQDEYDHEEEEIVNHADGSIDFDGLVLVNTIEEMFSIDISEHDEDTIGGYVFGLLGRKPELGDKVQIKNYEFEVIKVKGFRVQRVRAIKIEDVNIDNDEE